MFAAALSQLYFSAARCLAFASYSLRRIQRTDCSTASLSPLPPPTYESPSEPPVCKPLTSRPAAGRLKVALTSLGLTHPARLLPCSARGRGESCETGR